MFVFVCKFLFYIQHFDRPQTKFAKVMFSQVSVCPRRGGGGEGCLPHCMLEYIPHTPPSWADPLGRHPSPHRQTPWTDTPHPQADTPLGQTLPSACWDTVNKRVVRIPLECILVNNNVRLAEKNIEQRLLAISVSMIYCNFFVDIW